MDVPDKSSVELMWQGRKGSARSTADLIDGHNLVLARFFRLIVRLWLRRSRELWAPRQSAYAQILLLGRPD